MLVNVDCRLKICPSFFHSNIADMISESPLNKTEPLMEDHGGGGGGGVHGDTR